MTNGKKAYVNLAVLAATLVVNTLGALGFIGGRSQKEVSDMFNTLITPTPATFSIWSVIYTLIILSFVVLAIKHKDDYYGKVIELISPLFWISSLINIFWIVSFSFVLIELSTVLIFALLVSLVLIDKKLLRMEGKKRWLLPATFGLYSGWLLVATVVNIAAMLVKLRWTGFGISEAVWAAIIVMVAVLLAIVLMLTIKNALFPVPIAWAYWGIYQNLRSISASSFVETAVLTGMVLLLAAAIAQFVKNHLRILPE